MTETPSPAPVDPIQLDSLVRSVEPAARLVERRLLRRVIRRDLDMAVSANRAPHENAYWIDRAQLERIANAAELGLRVADLPPDRILLLPRPERGTSAEVLRECWRALFHARVDRVVGERLGLATSAAAVQRVFERLGPTTRHEIQVVLKEEGLLVPPASDRAVLREFAAYFFELLYFEPTRLPEFLPGLAGPDMAVQLLQPFVDAQAILEATRLPGTAPAPVGHAADSGVHDLGSPVHVPPVSAGERDRCLAQARQAAEKGNDVRAAIHFLRADETAAAEARLQHLVERLQRALRTTEAEPWRIALRPLLEASAAGPWPVAARLLYDLQKACVDSERALYDVDLVEWLVSVGTRPVKRQLDKPREVNLLRHLRSAARHLERVPLPLLERELLGRLLREQAGAAEQRVRHDMGPVIAGVLDEVGVAPANAAEKVARHKLVEELLDRIGERGFLRMGDLRDALARNRLKLPDLRGPLEWARGDPLLRANRLLAERLDGVYHRGEIYLRALQRFSALAFGTRVGRFLTRYLALPFGGAFIILEGLQHLVGAVEGGIHFLKGYHAQLRSAGPLAGVGAYAHDPHGPSWATWPAVGMLGLFLLGVLYWPAFRHRVGQAARAVFVDLPTAVVRSALVRAVFDNAATRFVGRYLLVPVLTGGLVTLLLRLLGAPGQDALQTGAGFAVLTIIVFRTPAGRGVEERLNDALAHFWRVVTVNFVLGLLGLIVDFFRALLELLERALYAVDEQLRFREGDGPVSFWIKLVVGFAWFWVTYIVRFGINLLIEPQVNPVKHFPVVTVSHKLLLPLIPSLSNILNLSIETTTLIVSGIPGIFGFLVWEFKENWKLYQANRSPTLDPVPVGSHGDKVRGLLRPGFHSGVVPKTFAKLRRALRAGDHRRAHKHEHALHHAAEGVQRFIEREFLAPLRVSRRWGGLPLHLDDIALSPHRIRLRLTLGHDPVPLVIAVEERSGWLFAAIEEAGWLAKLSPKQGAAFTDAVLGLYCLAGVHVVREQAAAVLGQPAYAADAQSDALVVFAANGSSIRYVWGDTAEMAPTAGDGAPAGGRVVATTDLIFSTRQLAWDRWVERWEQDQTGKVPVGPLLPGWHVLPAAT